MSDDVSASSGTSSERLKILDMLADGKLTPGQAADLLAALGRADLIEDDFDDAAAFEMDAALAEMVEQVEDERVSAVSVVEAQTGDEHAGGSKAAGWAEPAAREAPSGGSKAAPVDMRKWQRWWTLPLGIGGLTVILSGWLLFLGVQREWGWFWMGCLWLPLFLGILLTMVGWLSRTSRWIHIRVDTGEDEWPRHIAISLPLPIRLIVWFLRTFGIHIPKLRGMDVEMILEQVTSALSPEEPLYIEVDNGTSGADGSGKEKVQIYIG